MVRTKLLAMLVAVGLVCGVALAADTTTKPAGLSGKIVKVDGDKVIVKPDQKDAKEVTVATDAKTKVTVDGKEGKLADLKATMAVMVTPAEGTAELIAAKAVAAGG